MFKKQQGIEYIDLKSKSGQERKFFKVKYLGSGGFARCYEIYEQLNGTQQHYAFKIIKKSTLYQTKELIDRLRTQIKLHKKFSQPNETANQHIVRFIQSFQTQDYIYLLLQLCVNQTLNELIRRRKFLTEEQTRFYIYQLATGLKEIHSKHVVHRDIKLCNLFLSTGLRMKIGDFGLATEILENRKRYTVCGTANYVAPQMIKKDHNGGSFGHGYEVDVWALGVVCYTIFFGRYPFEAQEEEQIYDKVLACKYSFNPYSMKEMKELNINTLNHYPSEQLKSFIKGIFEINPAKRMTLDEVLAHQFLNKTTVPKELPEISLKCTLKRETIDKMFVKKDNKDPMKKDEKESQYAQIYQKGEKLTQELKDSSQQTSSEQVKVTQLNHQICLKKTQSTETQQENIKIQENSLMQIKSQTNQITRAENGDTSRTSGSLYVKFERKIKQSFQKMDSEQILLEIILSQPIIQNLSLKESISNGLMIKVYNLKDRQPINGQSTRIQYTIILHPKLNYLTKVFQAPKSQTCQRIPLQEVTEEPKNTQTTTHTERRVVVKIPFTKPVFSKNENIVTQKYMQEVNIAKMVCHYLNHKMKEKAEIPPFKQLVAI